MAAEALGKTRTSGLDAYLWVRRRSRCVSDRASGRRRRPETGYEVLGTEVVVDAPKVHVVRGRYGGERPQNYGRRWVLMDRDAIRLLSATCTRSWSTGKRVDPPRACWPAAEGADEEMSGDRCLMKRLSEDERLQATFIAQVAASFHLCPPRRASRLARVGERWKLSCAINAALLSSRSSTACVPVCPFGTFPTRHSLLCPLPPNTTIPTWPLWPLHPFLHLSILCYSCNNAASHTSTPLDWYVSIGHSRML